MKCLILALAIFGLATSAWGLETKAYQMREDFGAAPLYDCALQYYYYIPCPTYSWFWAFTGWQPGDVIGACFRVGDQGTGGWPSCDPSMCQSLEQIRILDFAGYGTVYVGWFTFELDVYCCPASQNPYLHLWNSGPLESHYGWNYFAVDPQLCFTRCCSQPLPLCNPRIIVTATMTGNYAGYPAWGFDNISAPLETGCLMHDIGCLPAAYPRFPAGQGQAVVHSGYVGSSPFEYWPPQALCDGRDTTGNCTQFGALDAAWRIYIKCEGPTPAAPSSWGNIKSIYR